ncbi:hypothetical protein [Streptomyces sp. CBMA123]|uniref:hypothetical protein n=1 Tax=Streptomyces sp. CBMA123 TaxID=1896313 RepID=UPI001661E3C1|nr:hypothetical protein [Streptomyces sp. CBMA123]MBD0692560.1 hypothetical protein [Streptomyces sp. CBMA123]
MRGAGYNLLTRLLTDVGHTPEQAAAAIARAEYDVLDWSVSVAEGTNWRCPEGRTEDFDTGWMAACDAAGARLAERAEQARVEARNDGLAVPPGRTWSTHARPALSR